MLEVEEFFTLNIENPVTQEEMIINEDGQDSVSINVQFNKVALNSGEGIE